MNQIVTKGIVLTRTDYGEADRIITMLTPDHGKVRVIAKGVRRVKSKLAGGIELFSVSNITYIPGRKEIGTLVSTRLLRHFGNIVKDIDRTMLGYDLLKRLNKATEDDVDDDYFALLTEGLLALDGALHPRVIEMWFDAQLLRLSGHQPNLITDSKQRKLQASDQYGFDFETMTFFARDGGEFTTDHIKLLRLVFELPSPHRLQTITAIDTLTSKVAPLITNIRKLYIPF